MAQRKLLDLTISNPRVGCPRSPIRSVASSAQKSGTIFLEMEEIKISRRWLAPAGPRVETAIRRAKVPAGDPEKLYSLKLGNAVVAQPTQETQKNSFRKHMK